MEMNKTNNQKYYSLKEQGSRFSEFVKDAFFKLAILPVDTALRVANARYEINKFDWVRR